MFVKNCVCDDCVGENRGDGEGNEKRGGKAPLYSLLSKLIALSPNTMYALARTSRGEKLFRPGSFPNRFLEPLFEIRTAARVWGLVVISQNPAYAWEVLRLNLQKHRTRSWPVNSIDSPMESKRIRIPDAGNLARSKYVVVF